MPNVFYMLEEQSVASDPDETILETSLRAGIPHAHACGGVARCSTCRVVIVEGIEHCVERNYLEQMLASRLHFAPKSGSRVRQALAAI
jgi:adenylate cyclase